MGQPGDKEITTFHSVPLLAWGTLPDGLHHLRILDVVALMTEVSCHQKHRVNVRKSKDRNRWPKTVFLEPFHRRLSEAEVKVGTYSRELWIVRVGSLAQANVLDR